MVEDGTGKANAESYVSVADAGAYAAARGLAFNVTGAPAIALAEQALRRATEWLDAKYASRFGGRWAVVGQALQWPRFGAFYRYPWAEDQSPAWPSGIDLSYISSTTIPPQLIAATIQAAVRELASPGSLNPDVIPGKVKKRVKVDVIEVEYAVGSGGVASQTPIVSIIDGILAPLIGSAQSPYTGKAVRA